MAITPLSTRLAALTIVLSLAAVNLTAQTAIKLPKNKFTPEQDVKLGLEAANEVKQQYPVIKDENIAKYLSALGDRLVAAAPPQAVRIVARTRIRVYSAGCRRGCRIAPSPSSMVEGPRSKVRDAYHIGPVRDLRPSTPSTFDPVIPSSASDSPPAAPAAPS